MNTNRQTNAYSIGWDVGGWNCDRNRKSRDAIVILNKDRVVVGEPWRGNLRTTINEASTSRDLIHRLFKLCKNQLPNSNVEVTLAIDTPLGFSTEFQNLVTSRTPQSIIGLANSNQYLYRKTERLLFERDIRPLSAIKDMIGSQATKGMHALAKFARYPLSCGVWSDKNILTAIEVYPAPCKKSALAKRLLENFKLRVVNDDIYDAATCAIVAHIFRTNRSELWSPSNEIPINEGWIWLPKDVFSQ